MSTKQEQLAQCQGLVRGSTVYVNGVPGVLDKAEIGTTQPLGIDCEEWVPWDPRLKPTGDVVYTGTLHLSFTGRDVFTKILAATSPGVDVIIGSAHFPFYILQSCIHEQGVRVVLTAKPGNAPGETN